MRKPPAFSRAPSDSGNWLRVASVTRLPTPDSPSLFLKSGSVVQAMTSHRFSRMPDSKRDVISYPRASGVTVKAPTLRFSG